MEAKIPPPLREASWTADNNRREDVLQSAPTSWGVPPAPTPQPTVFVGKEAQEKLEQLLGISERSTKVRSVDIGTARATAERRLAWLAALALGMPTVCIAGIASGFAVAAAGVLVVAALLLLVAYLAKQNAMYQVQLVREQISSRTLVGAIDKPWIFDREAPPNGTVHDDRGENHAQRNATTTVELQVNNETVTLIAPAATYGRPGRFALAGPCRVDVLRIGDEQLLMGIELSEQATLTAPYVDVEAPFVRKSSAARAASTEQAEHRSLQIKVVSIAAILAGFSIALFSQAYALWRMQSTMRREPNHGSNSRPTVARVHVYDEQPPRMNPVFGSNIDRAPTNYGSRNAGAAAPAEIEQFASIPLQTSRVEVGRVYLPENPFVLEDDPGQDSDEARYAELLSASFHAAADRIQACQSTSRIDGDVVVEVSLLRVGDPTILVVENTTGDPELAKCAVRQLQRDPLPVITWPAGRRITFAVRIGFIR